MKHNFLFLNILLIFLFSFKCQSQITSSWTPLTSGTTSTLLGVSAPSNDSCFVSGTSGLILNTIDGGVSWTTQTSGTSNSLHSITFIDNNKGFAVGDNGTVIKTLNAGLTWSPVNLSTSQPLRFVYFYNSSLGFISGSNGNIFKTTDGGNIWTSVTSGTGTTQQINSIYFTSINTGYASAFGGVLIKTIDGGNTWSPLSSGVSTPLGIIQFQSSTSGILIGDGDLIKQSTNSGTTWNSIANTSIGNNLTGMDFYNSSNGFIVGGNTTTNTGVILNTTNGGSSWSLYNPASSRLIRVDFVNANIGYAVGLNGTILKYSSNVGITENNLSQVKFNSYPNPFSTTTTIDLGGHKFENEITVELYDLTGKLLMNKLIQNQNNVLIERNSLSEGIYIYKILDGNTYIGSGKMTIQ